MSTKYTSNVFGLENRQGARFFELTKNTVEI